MRIGIDGTPLTIPFHGGTRHYAEQLLLAIARLDDKNDYVVFTPKKVNTVTRRNFKFVSFPHIMPVFKRQLFLPMLVKREHLDLFHYLEPFGSYIFHHPRIITTVHDLDLEVIHPKVTNPGRFIKRWYPEIIRRGTLQNTHTCIVVSKFTKNELQLYTRQHKLRLNSIVIYNACSPDFQVLNQHEYHKDNYFLCMGDFSPRKNIPNVLEAFSKFQKSVKSSYRLKIVVSSFVPKKEIMKKAEVLGIMSHVDICENVSFRELMELYNKALVFLYPSLYEGFGIPILEAMACGCPVITSDRGAMKEIAGRAAFLVNPEDASDILRAMRLVLEDKKTTFALKQAGLERVKKFSWEQTARKTLAVYKSTYMS